MKQKKAITKSNDVSVYQVDSYGILVITTHPQRDLRYTLP